MISLIFLIVITDPYRNINYDKINVYEINQEQEIKINNYSPNDDKPEPEPIEYYAPPVENTYYIFR